MVDQFCLKWNNYQLSLTSAFKHLLEEEDFVDVTLSAEGQSLKAHKVVLSACSQYFTELLRGISLWQHPVLVLRDVPFLELQSILEFVYLGEVNVEQDRLQSFLKTAELLRIKGLTDGIPIKKESSDSKSMEKIVSKIIENRDKSLTSQPVVKPTPPQTNDIATKLKRPLSAMSDESVSPLSSPKKPHFNPTTEIQNKVNESKEEQINVHAKDEMENDSNDNYIDYENRESHLYDGEHIIVAGDPVTNSDFDSSSDLGSDFGGGELVVNTEELGPLHKRCPHCPMVMLKKNLSRHIRDQHSVGRPRSNCPVCQKSYKTPDWLKDHIRRGHGYTKEATDELIAQLNLKTPITPQKLKTPGTIAPVVAAN